MFCSLFKFICSEKSLVSLVFFSFFAKETTENELEVIQDLINEDLDDPETTVAPVDPSLVNAPGDTDPKGKERLREMSLGC